MKINVSVIIVNYNTKELLKQCLLSVFEKTTDIGFEIIVVDNASIDNSAEMVEKYFPLITLIKNTENLGFGRANNQAAKLSKGKYLFLLNSDTVLLNNSIKILYDFLENNPKAKIAGGALFDPNGKPNTSFGNFPSLLQEFSDIGFSFLYKNYYYNHLAVGLTCSKKQPFIVDYVSGADMMIEKSIFDNLKGFDEDFFLYYEETEFSYRIKKEGWFSYIVPQAKIIHLESVSIISSAKKRRMKRSKKLFFAKCYGKYSLIFLALSSSLNKLTHCTRKKQNH